MTETNPFGDMDKIFEESLKNQLETVKELDEMDVDVTEWEANFLESVIVQLRDKKRPLSQSQIDVVRKMCEQYDVGCDL